MNQCPPKQKTLKRISGSQLFSKQLPQPLPRRPFNKIVRYSKLETLPKLDCQRSYRSVPTALELYIHKQKKRDSKELYINDRVLNSVSQLPRSSIRKRIIDGDKQNKGSLNIIKL